MERSSTSIQPANLPKEMGTALCFNQFGREKKLRFLAVAPSLWPDLSAICQAVGVARSTVYLHRIKDKQFEAALKEIDDAHCDGLERNMLELGRKPTPSTFNDRIAYLRAHRPELYSPVKVVRVEGVKLSSGEADGRSRAAAEAIEGEIVGNYRKRKAKQRLKIGAGEGGAGGGGVK